MADQPNYVRSDNETSQTVFTPGSQGPIGPRGNSVLSGSGAPSAGLGVNGDFYIDTATDELYGPKTSGAWGSPTSLVGPEGPQGPQGDPGVAPSGTGFIKVTSGVLDTPVPYIQLDGGSTPAGNTSSIYKDGNSTVVNAPTGGQIDFGIGGTLGSRLSGSGLTFHVVHTLAGPASVAIYRGTSTELHANAISGYQLNLAGSSAIRFTSVTGGAGHFLRQETSGGAVTSGVLTTSDIPSGIDAAKIGSGTVSNTEFGYLDGVTSSLQTQLDSKALSSHTHSASDITSGTLNAARLPSGIDAANIGSGLVSNTEFGYLDGVTSAIQTQLDGKAASSHTHNATDIGPGTVSNTEFGYLDGVTSAIQTQLDGKAASSHTHSASDITSGTLNAARLPSGIDAANIGSGLVSNAEFGYLDGVTSAIQTQLDGKASSSHTHSAGDITSGTLNAARLPSGIDAANIGSGLVSNTEFGYLDGVTSAIQTQLDGKAATSHTHSASDITSGTLNTARLPSGIDAANIGSGLVSNTEFGYLDGVTSAIQTQLDGKAASSHTHNATDIGAGTVSNTEFGYLDGVTSAIQTQLDGKAASSHTHAASAITSGQLSPARGGTGADLSATGGSSQFLKQTTLGGNVTVATILAADLPAGIDATKIGLSLVNNTEFGYLSGATSNIQTQLNPPVAHAVALCGSGSDGDTTISTTVTLTRNMFYRNLTIASGGILKPSGYKVYVSGTLSFSGGGYIELNGNDGTGTTAGTAWSTVVLGGGGGGGAGATGGTGAGANGSNGANYASSAYGNGGQGGPNGLTGGTGGAGSNAGGSSGSSGTQGSSHFYEYIVDEFSDFSSLARGGNGGAGGGAGGGNGTNAGGNGGGGGGGGRFGAFFINTLDLTGASAGCIRAIGGNGAAGTSGAGASNTGGGGGGNGGGGGYIYGLCLKLVGSLTNAFQATGGAGGNGGNATTGGTGGRGGCGGTGGNIDFFNGTAWVKARGSAGSVATAPSGTSGTSGGAGGACNLSL